MKEPKLTHTQRRSGVYYFRRKIPLELIAHYGKAEIAISLKTKDRKEAEPLARKWSVFYDTEFAKVRKSLSNITNSATTAQSEIKSINKTLEPIDINNAILMRVNTLRAARARDIAEGKGKFWTQVIRDQIEINDVFLQTGEHPLIEGNPSIIEAEVFNIAANHVLNGAPLPFMHMVMPATSTNKPASAKPTKEKPIFFDDIVRKWKLDKKPEPRTVVQYQRHVSYFEELIEKLPVSQITKKHVIAYKDALQAQGASPNKINSSIATLQIMFNVALREDIIDVNPAIGIRVANKQFAKDKRMPFDSISLQKIFNSEIYTAGARPLGGKGEAAYWIPLLAIFTGARLEELSQLKTNDVRTEEYNNDSGSKDKAWIIHITNEGEGQKLKNAGSRRKVPIHKTLIELGFINYVQSQKEGFIFPKLLLSKRFNERSANWSKWFGKYLRLKLKITDDKLVFHSFRHTFKDLMRHAGIADDVNNAFTGHSMGNVGNNYGAVYYPLLPLVKAMDKYSVMV